MNKAWVSGRAGIAVVETSSQVFVLEAGRQAPPEPCSPGQLNNLRALASDVVSMEAGSFPFPAVKEALEGASDEQSALDFTLMTLDRDLSADLRKKAAAMAARLLAEEAIREAVRRRLLGTPFPEVADFEGAPLEGVVSDLVREAAENRELVAIVSRAWDRVFWEHFSYRERERLKDICIVEGGFAALVSALRKNDDRIFVTWLESLSKGSEIYSNTVGVLLSEWQGESKRLAKRPDILEDRGNLSLDAIGQKLKAEALKLENDPKRRPKFRFHLKGLSENLLPKPTRDRDLIMLADRFELPGWAVECLPSLFVVSNDVEDGNVTVLLWHFLAACMGEPGEGWQQREVLCAGHVIKVAVDVEMLAWLYRVAPEFEARRASLPYFSEGAMRGAALDTMAALEASERVNGRTRSAGRFKRARASFLRGYLPKSPRPQAGRIAEALRKMSNSLAGDERREEEFNKRIQVLSGLQGKKPDFVIELASLAESQLPRWAAAQTRELRG